MSSAATVPNQITPAQALGQLIGADLSTATAVLLAAPSQALPIGLSVLTALTTAEAQLAIGIRRPTNPFAF